jgi:hypothetical protein
MPLLLPHTHIPPHHAMFPTLTETKSFKYILPIYNVASIYERKAAGSVHPEERETLNMNERDNKSRSPFSHASAFEYV